MGNAFGGLFLYDFLGVQAMKASFGASPFRGVADFAEQLPFATFTGKHAAAARYFRSTDAAIICVQEGRALFDFPAISQRYRCFQASGDEYTMVLLPQGTEAESFSTSVHQALEAQARADVAKATATTPRNSDSEDPHSGKSMG